MELVFLSQRYYKKATHLSLSLRLRSTTDNLIAEKALPIPCNSYPKDDTREIIYTFVLGETL